MRGLATFLSPTEVKAELRKDFRVDVSLRQIVYYDATSKNPDLAQTWIDLFTSTREHYLSDLEEIPISHRAIRLRRLERMEHKAEERGNYALAMQILEQVAKEMGGFYANRQKIEHTGADGKPLRPSVINVVLVDPKGDRPRVEVKHSSSIDGDRQPIPLSLPTGEH